MVDFIKQGKWEELAVLFLGHKDIIHISSP
jgi:hypothetical protein